MGREIGGNGKRGRREWGERLSDKNIGRIGEKGKY